MFHSKYVVILLTALALILPNAGFSSASTSTSHSSKQVHHNKTKALSKNRKHAKTGERKKPLIGQEQTGIFTVYTGKARKNQHTKKTADGTSLKENSSCLLANNSLPSGTKVVIESIGTCEVHDRIGRKTRPNHFDIHVNASQKWAKNFGKQRLKYKIINEPAKT